MSKKSKKSLTPRGPFAVLVNSELQVCNRSASPTHIRSQLANFRMPIDLKDGMRFDQLGLLTVFASEQKPQNYDFFIKVGRSTAVFIAKTVNDTVPKDMAGKVSFKSKELVHPITAAITFERFSCIERPFDTERAEVDSGVRFSLGIVPAMTTQQVVAETSETLASLPSGDDKKSTKLSAKQAYQAKQKLKRAAKADKKAAKEAAKPMKKLQKASAKQSKKAAKKMAAERLAPRKKAA